MPRSRGEQERAHLVAKGASNPANVSHQCTKRAPSASSKIARAKRFLVLFHRTEREKYYKHGEKAKRNLWMAWIRPRITFHTLISTPR